MGRIAFLIAATLIAGGFGMQQTFAQTDTKSEKAEKKAEKKKQTTTQTNSNESAPMSGFRPDMKSNY